jgi:hypothetical protein
VAQQWKPKRYVSVATVIHATIEKERVFRQTELSEPEAVVRLSPASKGMNTEAEEATTLEAVTRREPVTTQQTEKI